MLRALGGGNTSGAISSKIAASSVVGDACDFNLNEFKGSLQSPFSSASPQNLRGWVIPSKNV